MTYHENITSWLEAAGPDEIERGRSWYAIARGTAEKLAEDFGLSLEQSAGVIAALSPQMHWNDNVRGARICMETYAAGGSPVDTVGVTAYHENIVKAWRIMADPAFGRRGTICDGLRPGKRVHRVKCNGASHRCKAPLHGPKVSAFYRAILGQPDGAVDVWATRAADIAYSEIDGLAPTDPRRAGDPNIGGRRHADITAAYAAAGEAFGLAGHEAQAVVWVTIRDSWKRADGRQNGRREDIPF